MTTRTITDHDKLFLLNVLADPSHDLEYAAEASQLPVDVVRDIVANHGWPDRAKIATAAKMVRGKIERAGSVAHVQQPRPHVSQAQPPAKVVAARPATAPPIVCKHTKVIDAGKASDRKATRALAERAEAAIKQLGDQLARDAAKAREQASAAAARAAEEKAREAARAKVEELEAQLAELRKKARKPSAAADPQAAKIRAWARENGRQVAVRGQIPAEVRKAYEEAQGGETE